MASSPERRKEFGKLIGLNLSLLRTSGVIRPGRGSNFIGRNVFGCVAFACLTVYTISYSYEFVTRAAYSNAALESFALIISFVGGEARFAILFCFRDECQRMLNVCEVLWSALNSDGRRIVRSFAKKIRHLTCWYLYSCSFTIFFYALAALGASRAGSETSGDNATFAASRRRLPYAFLLEIHETPCYEIAFVFQLFTMIDVGLTCVGVDTIGPLFALIACGHFDAIRSRLLEESPPDEAAADAPTPAQIENLRACLDHHRTLLEFCAEIERLTTLMFFIQLIGSTYNISLVGFKLAGDDPDKYKYITQLAIAVIQLFLCNWPADLLATKSEAIGRAAYFTPWYRHPSHLRGPTAMLLIRARKPVRLTAGKFVALSLETFASMISSAASFFTVVGGIN